MKNMKVLVTGSAGFIGYHLTRELLHKGNDVVGIDNINEYYDPSLKYARLAMSGIRESDIAWHEEATSDIFSNYRFVRCNLEDKQELVSLCEREHFDVVINLAAQAGVRYSIQNPDIYVQSNIVGFLNVLEACRYTKVKHLIYASSSSVYGMNESMPFSVNQNVDHPMSLYAATKKSNELMAHTYSHLYGIPTTGLRFFTVYGPWGRPDMAYFLFADAITKGKPIKVFNHGRMKRDFTYVDDIVGGILNVMKYPPKGDMNFDPRHPDPSSSSAPYRLYNIGNNTPVELMSFIREIEKNLGKEAIMEFEEMQEGDVMDTWANIDGLQKMNYSPDTKIEDGLRHFVNWYKEMYQYA